MKQWQALVFPLSLTSLMYSGSFVLKTLSLVDSAKENMENGGRLSLDSVKSVFDTSINEIISTASNVMAWRTYVVVSSLLVQISVQFFLEYF